MLNSALGLAKGNDETKVGISVQIPKSLKEDFEELCKKNGVSMASMLQALVQIAVNEDKGIDTHLVMVSSDENYKKELFDSYLQDFYNATRTFSGLSEPTDSEEAEFYDSWQASIANAKNKLYKLGGLQ